MRRDAKEKYTLSAGMIIWISKCGNILYLKWLLQILLACYHVNPYFQTYRVLSPDSVPSSTDYIAFRIVHLLDP